MCLCCTTAVSLVRLFLAVVTLAGATAAAAVGATLSAPYRGRHADRLFTICYLPINLLVLLAIVRHHSHVRPVLRIVGGFVGFTVAVSAVPLVRRAPRCPPFFFLHAASSYQRWLFLSVHLLLLVLKLRWFQLPLLRLVFGSGQLPPAAGCYGMGGGSCCQHLPFVSIACCLNH